MTHYAALVRKERDSDFGIEFPDFPGCVTAVSAIEDAVSTAEEALRLHIQGMIEDGEPLPEPTPLEVVLESADARGAAAILVSLTPRKGRAMRVNVTIDEFLLAQIDIAARGRGMTRSAFLAMAAHDALDPFSAHIYESIPRGGRYFEGLKRLIVEEENKRRARENHPPDISKIGRPHR